MIDGIVNRSGLAEIALIVRGSRGQQLVTRAIIDTGFTGDLTLTKSDIELLGLASGGTRRGELADGTLVVFTVHQAVVRWHDREQEVTVLESNSDSLVGMSLLQGCRLTIDVIPDGKVAVVPLSASP